VKGAESQLLYQESPRLFIKLLALDINTTEKKIGGLGGQGRKRSKGGCASIES